MYSPHLTFLYQFQIIIVLFYRVTAFSSRADLINWSVVSSPLQMKGLKKKS